MEQCKIEFAAIEIGRYISKGSDGVISEVKIDGIFGKYVVKKFDNRIKYDEGKIKLMLQLKHPNVIELHKFCIDPFCLIMELCKCSLHDVIQKDLISAQDFTKYARQLADGMQYMHSQNIAHRDLKSDNVLLTMGSDIKICDLDRSKSLNLADVLTLTLAGTPLWMAPEMLVEQKYGASVSCEEWSRFILKVDIWSYGVILWEMITQRLPYDSMAATFRSFNDMHLFASNLSNSRVRLPIPSGTPPLLGRLLSECLMFKPDKRPNFDKIVQNINLVEIDEDNWNKFKPLWRKMPLDYNYSHREEENFISETNDFENLINLLERKTEYAALKIGQFISKGSDGIISEVKIDGIFDKYAMKKFDNHLKYDEEKIKLLLQLKHPNVIELHKYCIDPFCLITELCKCSLHDVIQNKDLISAQDFIKYARQLADGMKYMHSQKIAHRDLKSENVLITMGSDIKICDLDRSKSLDLANVLMSTQAGTPLWMAPEMLAGQKYGASVGFMELFRVRLKVDMWSFAVILWEMITQRLPYDSIVGTFKCHGDLHTFSTGLSNCVIRLSFPPGTPQLLRILLSQCLLKETNKRPNFDTINSCLSSLEIEEDHWTALKPLWREIPFDYTYSKEEEDDFIMRREYFTSTAKRCEELIENITKTGEDLENTTWKLETIKDIVSKREGLNWGWDISYLEEFALVEPNAQNLRRLLNDNKILKCDYDHYIKKIKPKVLCDDAIKLSILGLRKGDVEMRIPASELLFHVIQNKTRSPKEMVKLIILSVKAEDDVELIMNCCILLTLPIMRKVFSERSCLFLSNALRVHLKNAKITNLFWFIFDGLNGSLLVQLSVQMVETGLIEAIMKSLVSSENIENILVRNWWRILFVSMFSRQSSMIFITNGGTQCFHEHTKRYSNDPLILIYIFRVINKVVFYSTPRSQFLTNEFVEEHFRFLRLTCEHAPMCHWAVFSLAILLGESTWERVKMPKSSCSKTLVKIIMAWSLTIKWSDDWKPVLSIDDIDLRQSCKIFFLLKTPRLSYSSEDRFELFKSLQALIKDSKTSDDLRIYAKVARKLLLAKKR